MDHSDIAALMKGVAPVIRDLVSAAVRPLAARIEELERDLSDARAIDVPSIARDAAAEAVAAIPLPKDGADGRDGADGAPGERGADGERGPAGPAGRDGVDGKDGAPGERGADGAPGKDGTPGRDGVDGKDGLPGERGPEGPPGKLPAVRAWADGVSYEGDVCAHAGALWQAVRDTGRSPPHEDWICLASRGVDGRDARQMTIRGTWSADEAYSELDVVALSGSSFIAKVDDPGPCPGDGWQLIAARGKAGPAGERGAKGERGERGPAGVVTAVEIDGEGMLTLRNGDGSIVTCDLYPLLSKIEAR